MKTKPTRHSKTLAVILLALWCLILFGSFTLSLMAYDCQHFGRDCPSKFIDEVEAMEHTILLVQFAFFFFLPAACGICLPEGFSQVILVPAFSAISNYIKVISPPPRFSGC